ncbi:MAG: uncharacterized protein KVP18_000181 [Porospora cf. gigantea A]|uniref:uncharacterized protein n=2 Tax=Porospora cf. gigantea A TaxID=2853593 RepID=UPI003559FE9F|nr:MAG: hypothetical protein KVP18_000181 [Porospora cf. gigantea A]
MEVIGVHAGHCGIGMANAFMAHMETIEEIDNPARTFYNRGESPHYRGLLVDHDTKTLSNLEFGWSESWKHLEEANVIGRSAQHADPSGAMRSTQELWRLQLDERLRREAEKCCKLSGFLLTAGLEGNTGSSVMSFLTSTLPELYSKTTLLTVALVPSVVLGSSPLQIYAAVLGLASLVESDTPTLLVDNEALIDILRNFLHLSQVEYRDSNALVASLLELVFATTSVASRAESPYFPWADAVTSLTPTGLPFLVPGLSPLTSVKSVTQTAQRHPLSSLLRAPPCSVYDVVLDAFNPAGCLTAVDTVTGHTLQAGMFLRNVSPKTFSEMTTEWSVFQPQIYERWRQYIPNCLTASSHLTAREPPAAASLENSTAVARSFCGLLADCRKAFRRRSFTHCFSSGPLERDDINTAMESLSSVVDLYSSEHEAANATLMPVCPSVQWVDL